MPKRANVKRFDSPAVQGEDSHVTLRRFTWGEAKALRNDAKAAATDEAKFAVMGSAIITHLVEWNWVQDDDTPMLLPVKESDLDPMNDTEISFLSDCINDLIGVTKEESKN